MPFLREIDLSFVPELACLLLVETLDSFRAENRLWLTPLPVSAGSVFSRARCCDAVVLEVVTTVSFLAFIGWMLISIFSSLMNCSSARLSSISL